MHVACLGMGRQSGLRRVVLAVGLALVLYGKNDLQAGETDRSRQATTSQAANEEARRALPLNRLNPKDRQAVEFVVQNASLYRRLPSQVIDCDPQLYAYLLQKPEVVTSIWKTLELSDITLQRIGKNTYQANDGHGAVGQLKVLYSDHESHLIYGEGNYDGPLLTRPVQARFVLLLRSRGLRETNGRYYITCRLDSFVHIDHVGVEWVTKTLHPLLGKAADYNFAETMAFVGSLSRTAEVNPQGLAGVVRKLDVEPETRDQMLRITQEVSERAPRTATTPPPTRRR